MNKKEYYATRKPADCMLGEIYENEGGGEYICLYKSEKAGYYTFENIRSGWRLKAYGVGIYIDGKIDWDYSNGIGFRSDLDKHFEYDVVLRG